MIFTLIRNLSGIELFAVLMAFIGALVIALSFHEYAHALVAYKQGDDTAKLAGRLSLNPLNHLDLFGTILMLVCGFGWAKPVPINALNFKNYKKGIIKVSLAGILINLFLAILFSIFFVLNVKYNAEPTTAINIFLYNFCEYTMLINFVFAIFNLMPIPPLDGYNLVAICTKPNNPFVTFVTRYSFVLLILMIVLLIDPFLIFAETVILNPLLHLWLLIL